MYLHNISAALIAYFCSMYYTTLVYLYKVCFIT